MLPPRPVSVSVLGSRPALSGVAGRGPGRIRRVAGVGLLPPARSSHPARSSASSSSASSDAGVQAGEMPPPLAGRLGAVGSGGDCSASGRVRSPRPGSSGQSLRLVTMSYKKKKKSNKCINHFIQLNLELLNTGTVHSLGW